MRELYKKKYIKGKGIREHRYVMQQYLGRQLERNECVYHINGNKKDNRLENLELISREELPKKRQKLYKTKICKICGKEFEPPVSHRGRNTICSKECCDIHRQEIINKKKIIFRQLDEEGNLLSIYKGLNTICKINGWSSRKIRDCLNGKRKSAYGYKWERLS